MLPLSSFISSGGEMARRMREFDWSSHPLGPVDGWPQSLKIAVRIMLNSRFAMWMGWGPEFFFFCNDAYKPTLGIKQDYALGVPAAEVWAEIWSDIGSRAQSVVRTGEATWDESLLLFLERSGYPEETYHTFSYSPIPDDEGAVGGMLCVVTEETERVIGERRLAFLRDLGADLAAIKSEEELCRAVERRLSERSQDLPFALVYLIAEDGKTAHLACVHNLSAGTPPAPEIIVYGDNGAWPAASLFRKCDAVLVKDLHRHFESLPPGPWDQPARTALIVPIAQQGQKEPAGFLIAGLNPCRPLDAAYRGFLDLLAAQFAAGLASVRAYEAERKRAEALAEIDRTKTAFFSNVSHEFRTPLTLLLGPLEEILTGSLTNLQDKDVELVAVAHRNGLRLLKLVNSLLDFSRIEAGRATTRLEATDLSGFTADLASSFRSAMEKAGLNFVVDCPPLQTLVPLDRGMWEKVVLNLLSNAFKFTREGEVRVTVRERDGHVEMTVRDTGTGIPEDAKPHLFERFYRVQGAQGRTHEGSGIGLALVHELVKLHDGTVGVESEFGAGSAFIVNLPVRAVPGPEKPPAPRSSGTAANAFVAEAMRWLPDGGMGDEAIPAEVDAPDGAPHPLADRRCRILLADDNADMRDYVKRLLSQRFDVTAVPDGQAALDSALDERPDLVLTDVMMPRLDGFGLLRAMRADPSLESVPVIMLSARAGEDARIEGLEAGSDDYLIKPFHARELLAKIAGTLKLASMRAAAMKREAELEAERKHAEESLRDSELRFREIFEYAATGIAITDLHGNFEQCNPAYCRMLGYSEEELRNRDFSLLVHPDDLEENVAAIRRLQNGGVSSFEIENRYVRKDGSVVWVRKFGSMLRSGAGEPAHLVALVTDVTERRRVAASLLEAKEAAEAANLSKDRFLAILSHELRTPLTPVLLIAGDLENDPALPVDVREHCAMIRRNIELETKLIDDLLDLSRITSGKLVLHPEPVDLNEAVRHVCGICSASLQEKNLRLETTFDSSGGPVIADPARLQQVLWNVLKNAIKFTPEGGIIRVATKNLQGSRREVRVQDSGMGIPAEILPRIFDAFEQGDASVTRQFGGLGLGLAICRALVDLHRGSIRAESPGLNQGATFIIELPGDSPLPAKAAAPLSAREDSAYRLRILLAEDHADTARALSRLLRGAGFDVSAVSSVAAAIAAIENESFDILLSDVGLPDGKGYEIMQRLRKNGSTPGVAMSGYGMDEDVRRSREAGFAVHLVKPVSAPLLIDALRHAVESSSP